MYLLGHNSDWWNFWMLLSLGFVALSAIAAVVTTTAVVLTQKREAVESGQALERYKLEAGAKISAANEAAAKLEADNLALRQAISLRRHLADPQNVEALKGLDTKDIRIYLEQTADSDSMALNGLQRSNGLRALVQRRNGESLSRVSKYGHQTRIHTTL
jgi:hypothetical protein